MAKGHFQRVEKGPIRKGPLYYALRAAFGGCALYARLRAGVGGGWHGVILILDKIAKGHFIVPLTWHTAYSGKKTY